MRRDPENIKKKFVSSVVALVGLISLIFGLFEYQNAQRSLSWPTVIGRVYESRIVRNGDNYDPSYKAVIRYNYMVNHRVYKSSRVYFGSSFMLSSPEYPKELIHKFPFNSKPTVYYQQNDPNQAVLVGA